MELHIKTHESKKSENASISPPKRDFPCIPILLSILQNEYEQEKVRADRIDTKAIGLLTIIVALITVYVPIFPFSDVAKIYLHTKKCAAIPVVFSVFLLMGIIAAILALYSAYKVIEVYKAKSYQSVNILKFNTNEQMGATQSDRFQLQLIDHYQSLIFENAKINTNKAEILNNQFRNVMIIFMLLSLSAIGTLICIGI